jgi:hypothetical protein
MGKGKGEGEGGRERWGTDDAMPAAALGRCSGAKAGWVPDEPGGKPGCAVDTRTTRELSNETMEQ